MVQPNDTSQSPRGGRRIRLLQMSGAWRNSWRNSNRSVLETQEEQGKGEASDSAQETKRVRFPSESGIKTEILDDQGELSEDEMNDMWYNKTDYEKFEKDRVLTSLNYISSKRGAHNFDHQQDCIRGLESLTDNKVGKREAFEKKALKKEIKAEEQRQKCENVFPDFERFRVASLRHTRDAADRASSLALEDAKKVPARPKTRSKSRSKSPISESQHRRTLLSRLNRGARTEQCEP